ncbi:hypothetical protein F383_36109 [Gossypium arboreum]|nr:hypothetical protein F383_36109 [Gossypium arboreum]
MRLALSVRVQIV